MERCVRKGTSDTSVIAFIIHVPYFVSLSCSQSLSLPTATAPRLCAVGCVGCVSTINVPTGRGNL